MLDAGMQTQLKSYLENVRRSSWCHRQTTAQSRAR